MDGTPFRPEVWVPLTLPPGRDIGVPEIPTSELRLAAFNGFGGACAVPPLMPESVGAEVFLAPELDTIGDVEFVRCGARTVVARVDVPPTPAEGLAIITAAVIAAAAFGFTSISPLVGMGVGVFVAVLILMVYSRENKPCIFLHDCRRMLDIVGPLSMLPTLLAALGSVFTSAGVGDVIAQLVSNIIPSGNIVVGIIVYAVGMAIFTMIMGNAFAAITVMTVGIGAPFVLSLGADPVVVGSLALTCGYCGTLCTPMAANFNMVPVAVLEMKDSNGVIKKQVLIGVIMLVLQIIYMIVMC